MDDPLDLRELLADARVHAARMPDDKAARIMSRVEALERAMRVDGYGIVAQPPAEFRRTRRVA